MVSFPTALMLEYCVSLDIFPGEGETVDSVRERVGDQIRRWLTEGLAKSGFRDSKVGLGRITLGEGHEVNLTSTSVDSSWLDNYSWTRPHELDPGLLWRSDILITAGQSNLVLDLTIDLVSSVFEARRLPFTKVRPPRVVRDILSTNRVYNEPPGALLAPQDVAEADVSSTFVPLLESPKRTYPIVALAPSADSKATYGLPADRLQAELAGMARVYKLSQRATFRLTDSVGSKRSCFDGGIRIYWAGFSREANPYAHPLLLGDEIESAPVRAGERIFRLIRENAVFRYSESPEISGVRLKLLERDEAARDERIAALEGAVKKQIEESRELEATISERLKAEIARSQELGGYVATLRHDNDSMRNLLRLTSAQFEELRLENQSIKKTLREISHDFVEKGKIEVPPTTIHEASLRAQAKCPNLIVTGKALDLARSSEYSDPDKVYQTLLAANDVAAQLASGATFGRHWGEEIVAKAIDRGGFNLDFSPHLSITAKGKKFRHEYEVTYMSSGKPCTLLVEPHILLQRKGNKQEAARIFLDWDSRERKFVVSRIGIHPKNLAS